MRVLGLTGGIGSGKSMVAQMFAQLGAAVIDADQLAREVVEPGQPALREIAATFGPDVLLPDGRLDRPKLAGIIFTDPAERAKLDAITHPRIRERMEVQIKARRSGPGVLIVDIPLLYENKRTRSVEQGIVVSVDPETQLRRIQDRDGLSAEAARQRIAAQMPLDSKRARADHVIDNSGSPQDTRRQVQAIHRLYAPADTARPRRPEASRRSLASARSRRSISIGCRTRTAKRVSQTTARPTTNSTVPGAASDSLLLAPITSPTQLLDPVTPWKNNRIPPMMHARPSTKPASE